MNREVAQLLLVQLLKTKEAKYNSKLERNVAMLNMLEHIVERMLQQIIEEKQ